MWGGGVGVFENIGRGVGTTCVGKSVERGRERCVGMGKSGERCREVCWV